MDRFRQQQRRRQRDKDSAPTYRSFSDQCDDVIALAHGSEPLQLSILPVMEHVRKWEYLSTFSKPPRSLQARQNCTASSTQIGTVATVAAAAALSSVSIATNGVNQKYGADNYAEDSHVNKLNKIHCDNSSLLIARAIEDFTGLGDKSNIVFKKGDHIAVLERGINTYWRGYVIISDNMQQQQHHKGYFPCSAVRILDGIQTEHCSYGMDTAFPLPPPLVLNDSSSTSYSLLSNRNSDASVDSGRCSSHTIASSIDGKSVLGYPTVQISNNSCSYRHHGSLESGICRESYVSTSSSSSLGSLDEKAIDERGDADLQMGNSACHANYGVLAAAAVLERRGQGCPDAENLRLWLHDIKFQMYCKNLIDAGYDLGVMTRITPEDLNAVGITNPKHRKRLKNEIGYLSLPDGIPNFLPTSLLQWLRCLGLEEYQSTLMKQGYTHMDHVLDITWEDLEDIGIHKLGHQKKFTLAVERLKRLHSASTCPSASPQPLANPSTTHIHLHQLQQALYLQPQQLDMPMSPLGNEDGQRVDNVVFMTQPSPASTLQRSQHVDCGRQTTPRTHPLPATLYKSCSAVAVAVSVPVLPTQDQQHQQLSLTKPRPPLAPKPMAKPVATVIAQPANKSTWQTPSPNRTLEHKNASNSGTGSLNKQAPPPPPKRVTSIRSASCSASPVHSPIHQRASPASYENTQQTHVLLRECELSQPSTCLDANTLQTLQHSADRNVLKGLHDVSNPTCDDSHLVAGELAEPLQLQAAQLKNNASNTSMESAFIPFANENVGTIRQRQRNTVNDRSNKIPMSLLCHETNAACSISDVADVRSLQQTFEESFFTKTPPVPPVRRDSIQDSESSEKFQVNEELSNLDVICGMLEDLSSMLDREISEESYK